jgi:heme-degrading monooxygenase HmoA
VIGAGNVDAMVVVKINALTVPDGAGPEVEKRFAARLDALREQPGFLGFELLRPVSGETRYFVYSRWESEDAYQAWRDGAAMAAHAGTRGNTVSTGADLMEFEVAHSAEPTN